MKMKKYNQPTTEIFPVNTELMLNDLDVSINGGSGNSNPTAGMPGIKGGDAIE